MFYYARLQKKKKNEKVAIMLIHLLLHVFHYYLGILWLSVYFACFSQIAAYSKAMIMWINHLFNRKIIHNVPFF